MTAPTPRQLQLLKLLWAGLRIAEPEPGARTYRLLLEEREIGRVLRATHAGLRDGGWIEPDPLHTGTWTLTAGGRARAEVGAFVRHFAEVA